MNISSKPSKEESNSTNVLHNILAAGTAVRGDIVTEVDFRLDGKIEGNITCNGKIVVGPKGHITGNIIANSAEVMGYVEGSIKLNGKLVLKSTAAIKGDIHIQTLEIEPNARFNGTCVMSNGGTTPAPSNNPQNK